jgi:hypothetical protein
MVFLQTIHPFFVPIHPYKEAVYRFPGYLLVYPSPNAYFVTTIITDL